jgi:hypothetical protein
LAIAQSRPVLRGRALELVKERPVDLLDIDPPVLNGLECIGELHQLARGDFGIGKRAWRDEFHCGLIAAFLCLCEFRYSKTAGLGLTSLLHFLPRLARRQ